MPKFFSEGWFNKGFRPAMAWTIVAVFAVQFLIKPLLATWWPIEVISDAGLTALVSIFIGLSGMRTYERINDKVPKSD